MTKPDNSRTPTPPDAEGDGVVEHTPGTGQLKCDDSGLVIERFKNGTVSFDIFDASNWPGSDEDGMAYARLITVAPETAAERDRLIEDKENFEILINTLDGEVTRLKASNEALVNLLERCKEPITYYYRKKEDWGLCENINTALTKRGETQ